MANRTGRGALTGEALTLAPAEGGRTCATAGCHGSASPFGTEVSVDLLDLSGNPVSSYEPGENYRVNLNIAAQGAAGYGFMIVCLDQNNSGVSNWGAIPSQTRSITLLGRDYLEHTTRLSDSSFDFEWTAPESGTGPISFYAAGLAVNGNNSSSGDNADTTLISFPESIMSSVEDLKIEPVKIFPNPVRDQLTLVARGNYTIEILSMIGTPVYYQTVLTNSETSIDLSGLTQGSYLVRVTDTANQLIETKRIVKVD